MNQPAKAKKEYPPENYRLLPQSPDAEAGVLCSMLLVGPELIEDMDSRLTPESFHTAANRLIFHYMTAMNRARMPVDFITLTDTLRNEGALEEVGGAARITELFTFIPTAASAEYYADIVQQKALLRRMIQIGTEYAGRSYDEQDQAAQLLEEFQGELIELAQSGHDKDSLRGIKEDLLHAAELIEARYNKRGQLDGLSTGFTDLDRMLDGLKPACIYVVAGRPAMGKTAMGAAIAEHVVLENARRMKAGEKVERPGVAIFDLEMTREKRMARIFASRAEITREKLRRGFLSEKDFDRMNRVVADFAAAPLFLDATAGLTATKFKAQARRAVVKFKCGLIVIDYVQLMKGVTKRSRENRSLEITEIMAAIHETAKLLGVPIVVLAQIGRSAEENASNRPTMKDLKESGGIEEYADVVILLYRAIYYAKSQAQKEKLYTGIEQKKGFDRAQAEAYAETFAEADVDKNRDGATGTVELRFMGEFTRFEDPSGRPLYSTNPDKQQTRPDDE